MSKWSNSFFLTVLGVSCYSGLYMMFFSTTYPPWNHFFVICEPKYFSCSLVYRSEKPAGCHLQENPPMALSDLLGHTENISLPYPLSQIFSLWYLHIGNYCARLCDPSAYYLLINEWWWLFLWICVPINKKNKTKHIWHM